MFKIKILLSTIVLLLLKISVFAGELDFLQINGYGTFGGSYQENGNILYRDSLNTDEGARGNFSFANQTKLGLQLDVIANENITFTFQGLASQNNTNNKLISLQWANAKYQLNDSFDIRIGRMQLPIFMFSDISNISFFYDFVHLPDMYGAIPFHNYDGVELNFSNDYNTFSTALKVFYGESQDSLQTVSNDIALTSDLTIKKLYGIVFEFTIDDLKLRANYTQFDFSLDHQPINNILSFFKSLGIPSINQAIENNKIEAVKSSYIELGFNYDFQNAYLLGEYVNLNSRGFMSNTSSWYIGSGYHFEKWTPFLMFSKSKSKSNYENILIPTGSPAGLVAVITGANSAFSTIANSTRFEQETTSLGTRYDISDNVALKMQYDYLKESKDTPSLNIHFNNEEAQHLHIFSATINFVF